MKHIFLDLSMPVVIVECATGICYSGQVGGICCRHPEVEGYLDFPFYRERDWQPLVGVSCPDGCCQELSQEKAEEIDTILRHVSAMRFNFARLSQSTEAWFPVMLNDESIGWLLMPDNCD